MPKKKDSDYYKKLYNKLKKSNAEQTLKQEQVLGWYQEMLKVITKKSPDQKLVVSMIDIRAVTAMDKLDRIVDKDKNIIFEIRKEIIKWSKY